NPVTNNNLRIGSPSTNIIFDEGNLYLIGNASGTRQMINNITILTGQATENSIQQTSNADPSNLPATASLLQVTGGLNHTAGQGSTLNFVGGNQDLGTINTTGNEIRFGVVNPIITATVTFNQMATTTQPAIEYLTFNGTG